MKKLFQMLTLGLACTLLASCGGKPAASSQQQEDPESVVLVDKTYESFNVFGNNKVVSGQEEVDNDWAVKEFNGMTAISLKDAKAIDATLGAELAKKSIKGLYKFEGLVLGTKDAGWETDYLKDGAKAKLNGSYSFKACGCDKNEDEEWVKTCHFPSAESHGESLTPATLFITDNMSETPVDGFDHNSNPVALEAGVYTVVLATYKAGVGENNIMCGLGLVKTAAREPVAVAEAYPVTQLGAIGAFNGWAEDAVLTKDGNKFDGRITLAEKGEFKIRFNGDWKYSLGSGALADGQYHDNDGNIEKEAGTYAIHVELSAAAVADFLKDQTIVAFTISELQ